MTEQEFAYLSDRIRGRLTALARRFNRASGCDADAEDIVQDALLTLWQLSKKGYPIRDEEALAVKITKTRCIERYRRQHIRFEPIEDLSIAGGVSATIGVEEFDAQGSGESVDTHPDRRGHPADDAARDRGHRHHRGHPQGFLCHPDRPPERRKHLFVYPEMQ